MSATVSSFAGGPRALRRAPDGEYRSRLSFQVKAALTLLIAGVVLTGLVRYFDAPIVLLGISGLVAGTVLLLRPVYATAAVAFLLYTNLPVLAYKYHGVPKSVAGAFMLLLLFPLLSHLMIRNERLKYDFTFILMLAFLAILLLASIGVPGPDIARERILTYVLEGLLLYWLMINSVRHLSSLRAVLWTLVGAGALLGGLSLFQEVTGSFEQEFGGLAQRNYEYLMLRERLAADPDNPELRELVNSYTGGRAPRANGPLDEPNYFAQTLVMLLPLAVFLIRTASARRLRVIAIVSALAIAGGIIVTYSRGAFVAVVALAVIAVVLRWIRPSHFFVGVFALVLAFPFVAPDYLVQRVASLSRAVSVIESSQAQEADVAVRGRVTEMLAALQTWRDHPVLGVGPGQYSPFYSVEYHQMNPRFKIKDIRVTRRAHSLYLEMAAELGVLGLLLFLAIVFSTMRNLWRWRREMQRANDDAADLATALLLSLAGFLLTAVFLSFSYERYLWFILSVSGAALSIASVQRAVPVSTGARLPRHAFHPAAGASAAMSSGSVNA